MKKTLCILLALVMVIGLFAACGNETASNETTKANTEGSNNAAEGSSQEVITIDIWHSMEGTNGEAMAALIENFNATRGKELGIEAVNVFQGSDCAVKLKTLIQTNDVTNMPDVCQIYSASLPIVSQCAQACFIDDMYGQGSALISEEDIYSNMLATYTYEGRQVAIPFNASAILLYCNMDAFAEVGLTEDDIPTTWDEVIDVCEKLTIKNGDTVERYGLNMLLGRYEMANLVGSQGAKFMDNNNGRDGLVTDVACIEEMRNAYNMYAELIATGGLKPTYDNQNEEFATGLCAMTVMSSARIGSVTNLTKDGGINWKASFLPVFSEEDNSGVCVGGASLAMFDRGDDAKKMAAWEFIQYAVSAEAQCTWSMATGYLPVNVNTQNLDEYVAFVAENPAVQVALDEMAISDEGNQEAVLNMASEIATVFKTVCVELASGNLTAEEALNSTVEQCRAAFEQYNRANS